MRRGREKTSRGWPSAKRMKWDKIGNNCMQQVTVLTIVPSSEALMSSFPSALNDRDRTGLPCASIRLRDLLVARSSRVTEPSWDARATQPPSGATRVHKTCLHFSNSMDSTLVLVSKSQTLTLPFQLGEGDNWQKKETCVLLTTISCSEQLIQSSVGVPTQAPRLHRAAVELSDART